MKRIVLLLSFTVVTLAAMAQWTVNVNYSLWAPISEYNSDLELGFMGGNVKMGYIFDDHITGTFGVGYMKMGYENVRVDRVERPSEGFSDNAALQIIPITVGGNLYFTTNKVRPYFDMDFGVALVQATGDNMPDTEMKVNPFVSPGFGIEYELADDLKLNGVLKYNTIVYQFDNRDEYYETFNAVGVNLGLTYKF
jgi:long-subunit fatty acid transport protein